MTIKYNQELTDHRNTKNQSEMYERKKDAWKDSELPIKIQESNGNHELKISHHNNLYDQQIEMIKKEFKECINERGK